MTGCLAPAAHTFFVPLRSIGISILDSDHQTAVDGCCSTLASNNDIESFSNA
jgi:hypothetical protein